MKQGRGGSPESRFNGSGKPARIYHVKLQSMRCHKLGLVW